MIQKTTRTTRPSALASGRSPRGARHGAEPREAGGHGSPRREATGQSRRQLHTKTPIVPRIDSGKFRIIPLGGQEEVGRNMTLFEYKNDIIILDIGLQFPEENMPGIDYIIPDIRYLRGREKNIRGVILSHGHLDHIGAVTHILPKLGWPPVYASRLTLSMVAMTTIIPSPAII